MNKFAAILLLACVAAASANEVKLIDLNDPESQASLVPSDSEETEDLKGDLTVFSDFCIKSRDYVLGDIKVNTNSLSATVFSMFFKNAEEIGQSGLDAGKNAAEKEIEGMKAGDASIVKPATLYQSVVATVGAAANAVSSGVVTSLNSLKGAFGMAKIVMAIRNVCDQVAHYDNQNRNAFLEFATGVAQKDAALGATKFEQVPCLTARRVATVDGICKLANVSQGPVQKIMTNMKF